MNWLTVLLLAIVAVVAGATIAVVLHQGPLVQVNIPIPPSVEQNINQFIQAEEDSARQIGDTASAIRHQAWITTGIVAAAMLFFAIGFYLLFRVVEHLSHVEEKRAKHDIESQNFLVRWITGLFTGNGNGKPKLRNVPQKPKRSKARRKAKAPKGFWSHWQQWLRALGTLSTLHWTLRLVGLTFILLSFLLQLPP